MTILDSVKMLSHHAYYLIGSDAIHTDLFSILEKQHKIKTQGNPDFFDRVYETFVIDNAREVKIFHGTRPVTDTGKKVFVLQMNGITVEAQNALLKLLEEPAEYAHFFLIVPSVHILLPTVKSRMQEFRTDQGVKDSTRLHLSSAKSFGGARQGYGGQGNKDGARVATSADSEVLKIAQKLVTLSKPKRLEEVKKLADDISKDKKTKQDASELLNALQAIIRDERGVKEGKSALEAIEFARGYMHDRAPSVKMLLEYVMLNID